MTRRGPEIPASVPFGQLGIRRRNGTLAHRITFASRPQRSAPFAQRWHQKSLREQAFAAAPVQHRVDALLQLPGLVLVVMRRTLDADIFLVWRRQRRADRRVVRGGHGIVCLVFDLQHRCAADAGGILRPLRVRG